MTKPEGIHQGGFRPAGDRTADHYWKAGLIYVNRDDPVLFIEKRSGLGYTLNFGRAGTWLIIAALILFSVVIRLVIAGVNR